MRRPRAFLASLLLALALALGGLAGQAQAAASSCPVCNGSQAAQQAAMALAAAHACGPGLARLAARQAHDHAGRCCCHAVEQAAPLARAKGLLPPVPLALALEAVAPAAAGPRAGPALLPLAGPQRPPSGRS